MDLSQEQHRRNLQADDTWGLYASHRERVTRLLLDARAPSAERLCLLGAGNLNDIDLSALLSAFREIVLIDVDVAALQRGLVKQGVGGDERIRLLAPIDVTGVFAELSAIGDGQRAGAELIERCLRTLGQTPSLGIGSLCGVVASVGLVTQLIDAVVRSVGESHPQFWEIVSAVRA